VGDAEYKKESRPKKKRRPSTNSPARLLAKADVHLNLHRAVDYLTRCRALAAFQPRWVFNGVDAFPRHHRAPQYGVAAWGLEMHGYRHTARRRRASRGAQQVAHQEKF